MIPRDVQWSDNLVRYASWHRPGSVKTKAQPVKTEKECSCLLPWAIVAALATALIVEWAREK